MSFNIRLKEEIEFANLRYKELAEKSGVPERALYNYVASKNPSMPPADVAVKLAKALDVTVEYLVTGTSAKSSNELIFQEMQLFQKYRHLMKKIDNLSEDAKECIEFFINKLS